MPSRIIIAGLLAALTCGLARAEEPHRLGTLLAPFVDAQTLAVVHLDLAMFDVNETIDVLVEFFHLRQADRVRLQAAVAPISVFAQGLPPDAHCDLFFVVSVSDLAGLPFYVVLPLDENTAAPAIAMEVRRAMAGQLRAEVETAEISNALVLGSSRTLERLQRHAAVSRPEIGEAFAAVGESAVQVLLVPTADARRAMALLAPTLPESLGGGPTSELTRHFRWMALGLNLPPGDTGVQVAVECENATSAELLAARFSGLIDSLQSEGKPGESIPEVAKLTLPLKPHLEGARLTLEVFPDSDQVADYGRLFSPLLSIARAPNRGQKD